MITKESTQEHCQILVSTASTHNLYFNDITSDQLSGIIDFINNVTTDGLENDKLDCNIFVSKASKDNG